MDATWLDRHNPGLTIDCTRIPERQYGQICIDERKVGR
jgi:hypothetical protein